MSQGPKRGGQSHSEWEQDPAKVTRRLVDKKEKSAHACSQKLTTDRDNASHGSMAARMVSATEATATKGPSESNKQHTHTNVPVDKSDPDKYNL